MRCFTNGRRQVIIFKKFRTKGTVSIILIDLKCKDDDARFTTVPLKPYLINYVEEMVGLKRFSLIIPTCSPTGFLLQRKWETQLR